MNPAGLLFFKASALMQAFSRNHSPALARLFKCAYIYASARALSILKFQEKD